MTRNNGLAEKAGSDQDQLLVCIYGEYTKSQISREASLALLQYGQLSITYVLVFSAGHAIPVATGINLVYPRIYNYSKKCIRPTRRHWNLKAFDSSRVRNAPRTLNETPPRASTSLRG
jgi:hypothetical protein